MNHTPIKYLWKEKYISLIDKKRVISFFKENDSFKIY